MEADIRSRVVETRNCEEVMKVLNDSFSNAIQLSGAQGCLTEDPAKEIEEMARMYLESSRIGGAHALSGREIIVEAMREAWETAGVAAFLKPLPVARYTGAGDSFKFDFGYVTGNKVKLFHALSLRARVDTAVTLAARYPKIAASMKSAEQFPLIPSLMAVVDDDLDKKKDEIAFALAMMQESGIAASEVREMPRIAEAVREELGV